MAAETNEPANGGTATNNAFETGYGARERLNGVRAGKELREPREMAAKAVGIRKSRFTGWPLPVLTLRCARHVGARRARAGYDDGINYLWVRWGARDGRGSGWGQMERSPDRSGASLTLFLPRRTETRRVSMAFFRLKSMSILSITDPYKRRTKFIL